MSDRPPRRRPDVTDEELLGGVEKRGLVIVDYDSSWPDRYDHHRARIAAALARAAIEVEHIGSTAVPGLGAKPIIDILVTVPDITAEEDYLDPLLDAGYELRVREPGHRMVRTSDRDVHVHVLEVDDPAGAEYLLLRDHLRSDSADRALYERTKRDLAATDWADMNRYAEAKSDVIHEIKQRARARTNLSPIGQGGGMSHDHDHEHGDLRDLYSQEVWDERYAESHRIWSGEPNPRLVEHVAGLTPGDALDVGCGEGADAVWLARQGWRVTALDVSTVALERAAEHAREAGVGELVRPLHHDLMAGLESGDAVPGAYDLVSMHFLHVPRPVFAGFHRRLGEAVRLGGLLLVVGHHPDDVATGVRRPHGPDLLFPPERVVEALDPAAWEIRVSGAPTREMTTDDGPVTVRDSVVLAARL